MTFSNHIWLNLCKKLMQEVDSKQGKISFQLTVNSIQFDHGMFLVSVSTQAIYIYEKMEVHNLCSFKETAVAEVLSSDLPS